MVVTLFSEGSIRRGRVDDIHTWKSISHECRGLRILRGHRGSEGLNFNPSTVEASIIE